MNSKFSHKISTKSCQYNIKMSSPMAANPFLNFMFYI